MMVQEETEKVDELLAYLKENWERLYGSWSLRGKVKAQEALCVRHPACPLAQVVPGRAGTPCPEPDRV